MPSNLHDRRILGEDPGVSPAVTRETMSPRPPRAANRISRENVVRAYRRYAPVYDRLFGSVLNPGRRALSEAVARLQPGSLLEVGVGTGLTLSGYPRTSAIVGVDISREMLARARQRAMTLAHTNLRLEVMDGETLAFPDRSFDCVTLPYVLSVTPDPQRLVREVRRVCRIGGTILVLNHFSGSRLWWLLERAVRSSASQVGFRSDFGLAAEIARYDWRVEWVKDVNLFGLSKLISIRNA
jgi:phosphatidylethanolamine/phosphatidyl-N-methylethanolamine N-methyltransferase